MRLLVATLTARKTRRLARKTASGPHSGHVIHHQDHDTTPESFRGRRTRN
jgi:hypothetical protein